MSFKNKRSILSEKILTPCGRGNFSVRGTSTRKISEGLSIIFASFFTPHPEFLKLILRFEILPSPARGEGDWGRA